MRQSRFDGGHAPPASVRSLLGGRSPTSRSSTTCCLTSPKRLERLVQLGEISDMGDQSVTQPVDGDQALLDDPLAAAQRAPPNRWHHYHVTVVLDVVLGDDDATLERV